jgi:plasmid stability protein
MGRHPQLSIAVDSELREELEKRAAASGRSVAEEIRQRLTLSLDYERNFDEQTRRLGYDLMSLARNVRANSGFDWHAHPKAHEALTEAIRVFLQIATRPEVQNAPWGPDDPKTLGRTLARFRLAVKQAPERARKQLAETRPAFDAAIREIRESQRVRGRKGRKKS